MQWRIAVKVAIITDKGWVRLEPATTMTRQRTPRRHRKHYIQPMYSRRQGSIVQAVATLVAGEYATVGRGKSSKRVER